MFRRAGAVRSAGGVGYRWAGGDHPTVFIYDPNYPDVEQTLTFSMGDTDSIHGVESDGKTMRGFFVNPLPADHLHAKGSLP